MGEVEALWMEWARLSRYGMVSPMVWLHGQYHSREVWSTLEGHKYPTIGDGLSTYKRGMNTYTLFREEYYAER